MVWLRLLLSADCVNSPFRSVILPYAASTPRMTSSSMGACAETGKARASSIPSVMAIFMTSLYRSDGGGAGEIHGPVDDGGQAPQVLRARQGDRAHRGQMGRRHLDVHELDAGGAALLHQRHQR